MEFKSSYTVDEQYISAARMGLQSLRTRQDLGFQFLPQRDEIWERSEAAANKIKSQFERLVVVGMGGSALGGKALVECLGGKNVSFLHNTDPQTLRQFLLNSSELSKSHFLVVSKSGGTLEIAVILSLLVQKLKGMQRDLSSTVSVVTEMKSSPLYDWAVQNNIQIYPHAMDVGGRFSALSEVGLIPAAFAGVNIKSLRAGAIQVLQNEQLLEDVATTYLQSFADGKTISVFWSYLDSLQALLPWLSQLWAESLGKGQGRHSQSAPIVSTPFLALGASDQHSVLQQMMEGARDKMVLFFAASLDAGGGLQLTESCFGSFAYLKGKTAEEVYAVQLESTQAALTEVGVPTARLTLQEGSAESLGGLIMLFEMLIGILGEALDIDAFDQPGVELGKKIAQEKLKASQKNA